MNTIRKNRKLIAVIVIGVATDLFGHALEPPQPVVVPPSIIAEKGLLLPALAALVFVWFTISAVIFALIQENLPGSRLQKGLRYGFAFGVLWLLAMFEVSLVFPLPVQYSFRTGLVDGLATVFLGILLGILIGTDSASARFRKPRQGALAVLSVAAAFLAWRYFAYVILRFESGHFTHPLTNFLWTLGMGLWFGVTYWLLEQAFQGYSPLKRALWFGSLVLGSVWFIGGWFAPAAGRILLLPIAIRYGMDVVSFIVGVYAFAKFAQGRTIPQGFTIAE